MKQNTELRTFLRKNVYNTNRWKTLRQRLITQRKHCDYCNKLIIETRINIHHIEELTYENWMDESIAYGPENLMVLHSKCHNKVHEKNFEKKTMMLDGEVDFNNRDLLLKKG